MSVLIFLDQSENHIKKSSFEAACYGAKLAELTGTTAEAIVLGTVNDDLAGLGKYGIKKVHTVKNNSSPVDAPPIEAYKRVPPILSSRIYPSKEAGNPPAVVILVQAGLAFKPLIVR